MKKGHRAEIARLETIARWLDSHFRIPGTNIRFGLDSIFGLVPVLGDGASAIPAIYLIVRARQLGAPARVVARMIMNFLVDVTIGSIPFIGDMFDVGFKSNRRNVELLSAHLEGTATERKSSDDGDAARNWEPASPNRAS